ncbi:MAG TPA: hypothetical protein VGL15_01040 [Vicinamibacteria bacterium]|jgi:anti-sigma factor RsiW
MKGPLAVAFLSLVVAAPPARAQAPRPEPEWVKRSNANAQIDRQRYHDFLLAQGFLPPDMLSEAVLKDLVPAEQTRARGAASPARGAH